MCLVKSFQSLRSCDDAHKLDILSALFLDKINGSFGRTNVVAIIEGKNVNTNIDPEEPLTQDMRLIVIANRAKLNKLK